MTTKMLSHAVVVVGFVAYAFVLVMTALLIRVGYTRRKK
jgi:hypothetical protein